MSDGYSLFLLLAIVFAGFVAISCGVTWLTFNWWLPYTKIETNGLRYRVMQLNVFRVWQEYKNYTNIESAEYTAMRLITEWHEKNDKFRPLEKHERVAAKIAYFNRDKK